MREPGVRTPGSGAETGRQTIASTVLVCDTGYLNYFRRRRFRVPSEVPSTNAFCRTAPSERRSLRAICLAGTFLASDFSSRTSLFVHSRRVIFLRAAIINLLSDLSRYLQIKHLAAARKS